MPYVASLIVWVIIAVGMWKVFEKAGKPGWAGIVPIYNLLIILEIVGKPTWWIFLFFIPVVGLVVLILVCIAFAEKFGKEAGFGVGLALLGIVFFPILGFGDAQYIGAASASAPPVQ